MGREHSHAKVTNDYLAHPIQSRQTLLSKRLPHLCSSDTLHRLRYPLSICYSANVSISGGGHETTTDASDFRI